MSDWHFFSSYAYFCCSSVHGLSILPAGSNISHYYFPFHFNSFEWYIDENWWDWRAPYRKTDVVLLISKRLFSSFHLLLSVLYCCKLPSSDLLSLFSSSCVHRNKVSLRITISDISRLQRAEFPNFSNESRGVMPTPPSTCWLWGIPKWTYYNLSLPLILR